MAKHKAPTQITIASLQQDTAFNEFVDRYWKVGVGIAVVASLAVLVPTYLRGREHDVHHGIWDDLRARADLGGGFGASVQGGPPETLALFADQHKDSPVGAWAKALEIGSDVQAEKLDNAEKAAGQLEKLWPDHLLSSTKLIPADGGSARSLSDAIRTGTASLQAWEKEHAFLFENPPPPTDAPKVRLNTNKGPIVVALYSDRTPKHAENFLKLAKEGFYNGTEFHRVVRGSLIQGGDPNTKEGAPETWGHGGPEGKIDLELDPRLRHFKGALCAWKEPGATGSHGSQFFIATTNQNAMDGQSVVFGKVLEGDAAIEAIESGAVVDERPQDPAVIESVEVL